MTLLRNKVKAIETDITNSFNNVSIDIDWLLDEVDGLKKHIEALEDELATNGVVRDIRKLQKEVPELQEQLDNLHTNGLATAINALNDEVFKTEKKESDKMLTAMFRYHGYVYGSTAITSQPTLAGKVDAIIEHLGLDVSVKPKEVTESKVVAKKVKKVTKKGRR